jgi:hypothetical protein
MASEAPTIPTCDECGTEIQVDAMASWSVVDQEWELSSTYDAGYCSSCEHDDVQWSHTPYTGSPRDRLVALADEYHEITGSPLDSTAADMIGQARQLVEKLDRIDDTEHQDWTLTDLEQGDVHMLLGWLSEHIAEAQGEEKTG